jgi:hypothetical protein
MIELNAILYFVSKKKITKKKRNKKKEKKVVNIGVSFANIPLNRLKC